MRKGSRRKSSRRKGSKMKGSKRTDSRRNGSKRKDSNRKGSRRKGSESNVEPGRRATTGRGAGVIVARGMWSRVGWGVLEERMEGEMGWVTMCRIIDRYRYWFSI
jgi:hypothetical protein